NAAHGALHAIPRHALAEEDDVRLQDATAVDASRHVEGGEVAPLEICVAIGGLASIEPRPGRVRRQQSLLELIARHALLARHASNGIEPAMQVDNVAAA